MRITKRQLKRIIKEAMPRGGVPDVVGATTGVPGGNIQNLVDEYKEWATEYMGTSSGANSSSVLATFLVDRGLDQTDMGDDIIKDMGVAMKLGSSDLRREVDRARKEYDAGGTLSDKESHRRGFYERRLYEYSEHPTHTDIADHLEDAFGLVEEVMIKYVDSGWLADQDQMSLAKDLEKLFEDMNSLTNVFNTLSSGNAR